MENIQLNMESNHLRNASHFHQLISQIYQPTMIPIYDPNYYKRLCVDLNTNNPSRTITCSDHLSCNIGCVVENDDRLELPFNRWPTRGTTGKEARLPTLHQQTQLGWDTKPNFSYIGLIAKAILSTADQRMILSDIYQWIQHHYPYFRSRGPGWRNSIRHNLSLNDCFVKVGRAANGKGHYWGIHPANLHDFVVGDFRRRRAQRKVRLALGLSSPNDERDTPSPHSSPERGMTPVSTNKTGATSSSHHRNEMNSQQIEEHNRLLQYSGTQSTSLIWLNHLMKLYNPPKRSEFLLHSTNRPSAEQKKPDKLCFNVDNLLANTNEQYVPRDYSNSGLEHELNKPPKIHLEDTPPRNSTHDDGHMNRSKVLEFSKSRCVFYSSLRDKI